jgi:uncharacterized membrane protein (UPF0127 family)
MKKFPTILLALLLSALIQYPVQAVPAPQTNLPKVTLTLGTQSLTAQVAADDAARERGLMSRTNLAGNEAMLFVFPSPRPVAFWMKDTPTPLSIAYIGNSGRIFEIRDMKPFDETPIPSASGAVVYAIETPQGWFTKHGILAGSMVGGLPSPSTAK